MLPQHEGAVEIPKEVGSRDFFISHAEIFSQHCPHKPLLNADLFVLFYQKSDAPRCPNIFFLLEKLDYFFAYSLDFFFTNLLLASLAYEAVGITLEFSRELVGQDIANVKPLCQVLN